MDGILPGRDSDGFIAEDRLSAQAIKLSKAQFLEIYKLPALVSEASKRPASMCSDLPQHSVTIDPDDASEPHNYAGTIAFLAKREGNAFPQMISVGRIGANDIVINLASISRAHAIFVRGSEWSLSDRGSKNGVFVDSRRLDLRTFHPLKGGELIQFGPSYTCRLLFPSDLFAYLTKSN